MAMEGGNCQVGGIFPDSAKLTWLSSALCTSDGEENHTGGSNEGSPHLQTQILQRERNAKIKIKFCNPEQKKKSGDIKMHFR